MKNAALTQFLIVLVIALMFAGSYAFWLNEMRVLEERAASLSGEIAARSAEQARAAETKDALAALSADEAAIASHFIRTEDMVAFLENIETIGAEFGADVAVVSVSDPVDGKVTLALSIVGSFDAVMKTVGRIEYAPYGSATKSLTLDAGDDGLWSAALTVSILTTP